MGTRIEHIAVERGGWRSKHSALRLAVDAAKTSLRHAQLAPGEVDLLVNAGVYRERNLGEPALAAMIQEDVGANPEDPHEGAHGTFSFDVANGVCGVLNALQIADGFLRSGTIRRALIVASDVSPGRKASEDFPFAAAGAAALCSWVEGSEGLGPVSWCHRYDGGAAFQATIGLRDHRNVLRFSVSETLDEELAVAAHEAALACLGAAGVGVEDVAAVVAAPARPHFRALLAAALGVPRSSVVVAGGHPADERIHTAGLLAALARHDGGGRVLLVAAGAGVSAGAALYTGGSA